MVLSLLANLIILFYYLKYESKLDLRRFYQNFYLLYNVYFLFDFNILSK